MQEEIILEKNSQNEKQYYMENTRKEPNQIKQLDYYYEKSINALVQYIKKHDSNPSEKWWNQYAIRKKYLSSKTIGYLSGMGFNTFCRKTRKKVNKEKTKK